MQPVGEQRSPSPPGVSIVKALACQGLAVAWLALGEAVPLTTPQVVTVDSIDSVVLISTPLWRDWKESPGTPPPEWVA
ncbi:MAG: hypothetical protein AAGF31_03550 [Planctomycetota bacterium]